MNSQGKSKKLSKRELILGALTLLAVFFGFIKYIYLPKKSEIALLTQNIINQEVQLKTSRAELEAMSQVKGPALGGPAASGGGASGGLVSSTTSVNENSLPESSILDVTSRLGAFISEISNTENNSPFRLVRITNEEQAEIDGAITKMSFSLDVETTFMEIGKFVEKLERSPLLTEVRSMQMSRLDDDLRMISVKLKLTSYFQ